MSGYLSLDPHALVVVPDLLARLPVGLASYYQALPLACEDGAITVAMAHPENETALTVLADLLAAPVVPVSAPAAAIRRALCHYSALLPAPPPRVLAWSSSEEHADFVTAIACRFAVTLTGSVTVLTAPQLDLDAMLTVARQGQYRLTVLYPPREVAAAALLSQASTPLLLVRSKEECLRRILVVLRGFSADDQILDWLTPLLQLDTSVTLLPLSTADEVNGPLSLLGDRRGQGHLQACLRHPALCQTRATIRLRQGQILDQVRAEASQDTYDLIVIAAEGYGHVVSGILTAVEQRQADRPLSFFILKPPTNGVTS